MATDKLPPLPRTGWPVTLVAGRAGSRGCFAPGASLPLKRPGDEASPVYQARPATGLLPSSLVGRVLIVAGPAAHEAALQQSDVVLSQERVLAGERHICAHGTPPVMVGRCERGVA
jgi:hypothetical protein